MTPEREIVVEEFLRANREATLILTLLSNMEIRVAEIAHDLGIVYNIIIPTEDSTRKMKPGWEKVIVLAGTVDTTHSGRYYFKKLVETARMIVKKSDIVAVSGSGDLIEAIIETATREKVKIYDIDAHTR